MINNELADGLYERIMDSNTKQDIQKKKYKDFRSIDKSELSNVVSVAYQKIIHETLGEIENNFNNLKRYRPKTSIAHSTLFTGSSTTTLESELNREIRTADQMDFQIYQIQHYLVA